MIQEFEQLEKRYKEFADAYNDFSETNRAARTTISTVRRRISQAKRETDAAIQECKLVIADPFRTVAAQTAAGIKLEALLSRTFPITPEEEEQMTAAVAAADAAYFAARGARTNYDEAHEAARQKIKEMRDAVFGSVPSAMDLMHTRQTLHDNFTAVHEEAK